MRKLRTLYCSNRTETFQPHLSLLLVAGTRIQHSEREKAVPGHQSKKSSVKVEASGPSNEAKDTDSEESSLDQSEEPVHDVKANAKTNGMPNAQDLSSARMSLAEKRPEKQASDSFRKEQMPAQAEEEIANSKRATASLLEAKAEGNPKRHPLQLQTEPKYRAKKGGLEDKAKEKVKQTEGSADASNGNDLTTVETERVGERED